MKKIIDRIVLGSGSPNKNDLWIDDRNGLTLKVHDDGEWKPLAGGSGGSKPAKFVLRFKKENFFEYHDTYPNVVPIANVDDEFTLDEIFEMSDNTISNWINLFEKQVEVAENHNGVITWNPVSYMNDPAFVLTDDGGMNGESGGNDDEYGVFPSLTLGYNEKVILSIRGTNFGGGSIGVPYVEFIKTQEGKWSINQISGDN